MENFTPVSGLIGGLMIGAAASALVLLNGRIAGISGIVGGALTPAKGELAWRLAFIVGLVIGPLLVAAARGGMIPVTLQASGATLALAGFLVGFGTRMGAGCTSGHGVCGLSRLSPRSLVAVVLFMLTAMLTVAALRLAGAL